MSVIPNRRIILLLTLLALALLAGYEVRAASSAAVSRKAGSRALSLPASGFPAGERTWTCSSSSEEPDEAMDDMEDPADPQMADRVLMKSAQARCTADPPPSRTWCLSEAPLPSELRAPVLRRRIFKKP